MVFSVAVPFKVPQELFFGSIFHSNDVNAAITQVRELAHATWAVRTARRKRRYGNVHEVMFERAPPCLLFQLDAI